MGRTFRQWTTVGLAFSLLVGGAACRPLEDVTARAKIAVGLGCGELDKIDRPRLPATWDKGPLSPDGRDLFLVPDEFVREGQEVHERLQDAAIIKPSSAAEAEIRLVQISRGYVPPQYVRSVIAQREAGVWTVHAAFERQAPEGDNPDIQDPWVTKAGPRSVVRLSADRGRLLDLALSGRCLWDAPRYLPQALPLKAGGIYFCPPHGPDTIFDIRQGDRLWSGWQECRTTGPQMDIEQLLVETATGKSQGGLNPKLFRTGPSEDDPWGMDERAAAEKR